MKARVLPLWAIMLSSIVTVPGLHAQVLPAPAPAQEAKTSWKKTVVDKVFRSEGVAVADVNNDGKLDIIVGDVWYEAPDWKMHALRPEKFKSHDSTKYSEAFAVFAGDFNGDGFADVIVIPFPGKECFWYENPRGKNELWKEHLLTNSACNETPMFVDLFKTGKKVLVMGWNPPPKEKGFGEVCYFQPGQDPTKPWQRISISGDMGKHAPGSDKFYHGLGAGDVNGDGRDDVITPDGWWEQPAKLDGKPWKWHPAKIGQACADMHVLGKNSAGLADVVSSSAHGYGLWRHEQRPGNVFLTKDIFPPPPMLAREPKGFKFNKEEQTLFEAINKARDGLKYSRWQFDLKLCEFAKKAAAGQKEDGSLKYPAGLASVQSGNGDLKKAVQTFMRSVEEKKLTSPNRVIGVGFVKFDANSDRGEYAIALSEVGRFSLPGQTHALHFVDVNGDGLKDLVTGRRWWAHGASGDLSSSPADPAYLYWFEAKKDATGMITFTPHMIDDDSGIGTQFEVVDVNGDGRPDVVVSNKHGVFLFEQTPMRRPRER